jgi:hypothetical protein
MRLIFLYGPVASGTLTIGRALAERGGLALFHNHLIVDAVGAVFEFGSPSFVALRERLWLDIIGEAARAGRSLIFTFAPEPTVTAGFPERVRTLVEGAGGEVIFVALAVAADEQERRLTDPSRSQFGKMGSVDQLRRLRPGYDACFAAMPPPSLTIDTGASAPVAAAEAILARIGPRTFSRCGNADPS